MPKSYSDAYAAAGVDITAGYKSTQLMKADIEATSVPGAIGAIGGFGGLFAPDLSGYEEPVLVSGTDGVGTKLKIAFLLDKHDTIGIDGVAMCVNDIICAGARPLFFLDYIACGRNIPEKTAAIVKGVATGCKEAGCALIGGETAEHPGMMDPDEYDLAGFCVGIVDKKDMVGTSRVKPGDVIIGLYSSGLHSNGFSLVRRVFDIDSGASLERYEKELGHTLGEELLTPTLIYVQPILKLLKETEVHGLSHITGGGFYENLPRSFDEGLAAVIEKGSWPVPPVFNLIRQTGGISERDMFNTFNMGIGMTVIVSEHDAAGALATLRENGCKASLIGRIEEGEHTVIFRKGRLSL